MRGAILYGLRNAPAIIKPTDAIIRISATCVCGSDLWPSASSRSPSLGYIASRGAHFSHHLCGALPKVALEFTTELR
jgi:threonine dehydrogenase-like Zn-dependent dehydrogenase